MNISTTDNLPQICSEVGLSCESCTAESARHVAAVCKGLHGGMIGQMFVQIYPNPACAPMHRNFAAHYRAASVVGAAASNDLPVLPDVLPHVLPDTQPLPPRREVMFARRRTMAAVA